MAKKSTTPRPARTPRQVLAPKVAAIAAMSPDQLAARATELDQARAALKAAGDAAAAAQHALDALPNDATDEQRNDVLNTLEDAKKAVKAAEAALQKLTGSEAIPAGSHDGDVRQPGPAEASAPAAAEHRAVAGPVETTGGQDPASRPDAVASASGTHNPPSESEGQGGAGNAAGPAGGDHAPLDAGVLVVTTKRPSRWRAGRQFTKGGETRIPMIELTEAQFRAIREDPVLESYVEPS